MSASQGPENFWVVGIGASAGGLEALQAFVAHLNPNIPAAFIIAQHLAPHTKSLLVELLARRSQLPVHIAADKEKVQPGNIYVVPPNHDIDLEDGKLKLTVLGAEPRPKPSVDHFFESLSRSWGDRAVGIVLSGTGSDGSQGVRFIRAAGGLTLAQDDQSARYDGMPRSAVETGSVDLILAPDEMAKELENFLLIHSSQETNEEELQDSDHKVIQQILELVKSVTGNDFSLYKFSTIRRRVEKQMRSLGLESYLKYLEHLKENPQNCHALAQDALISVTTFFRDSDAFEALDQVLEKALAPKTGNQEFRVWVAGCATGEEAYSIAILVQEMMERLGKKLVLKMFATDLDQEALLKARSGFYRPEEVRGIPNDLLEKYFQPRGEGYEIRKFLREMIVFARQDLIQSPPFVKVDLITCRNVLIYFEAPLQKKVFEIFHYALNPGGILFLGKAESAQDPTLFDVIDRKLKIYRRVNSLPKVNPYQYRSSTAMNDPSARKSPPTPPIEEVIQKEVQQKYGISGVVIDEALNIIHILGKISNFVSFPQGQAHMNLSSILQGSAGSELMLLVRRVNQDGEGHNSRVLTLTNEQGESISYHLHVRPLKADRTRSLFLVLFEKQATVEPVQVLVPANPEEASGLRIYEVEQELAATKEHLQTVIEELGVSNEELQSLNEELSSTNEELQASNEQLETTNEELQSTNEELTTLNEELMNKSAELRAANLTLENIQNSISSPMVVVDADLRILRFNNEVGRIFEISLRDLGRDITRVSCHCEIPNFHQTLVSTLDSGKVSEITIEAHNVLYQLRMHPFFDERRKIIGAVLIFFDNTLLIRAEEKLRLSETRTRAILESSPTLIWTKDNLGRYLTVNQAFLDFFNLKDQEVIGQTDRDLFSAEIASQLRDGDLEVLYKRESIRKEEKFQLEERKNPKVLLLSRFPLVDRDQKNPYAVGTVALDISKQMEMQQALVESESRYKAIVEDQAVFVCRLSPERRFQFVNKAFTNYFGGFADVYLGKSFFELIDERDHAHVQEQLSRLTQQQPIVQFEHRLSRFGDSVRYIRWIIRAIFGQDGSVAELQTVGMDFTENRLEMDRLQQKENLYGEIFAHTSDYLSVFRVTEKNDFILESFNRSTETLRGYSYNQYFGRKLESLLEPEKQSLITRQFLKCLETGEPQVFEEEIRLPGGGIQYLSTTLVPVANIQGKTERIASISRDVSNFKRIEDELRAEKERAEFASRSKTDFLASMSHELRTPLNIVLGMADLLKENLKDDEQIRYVSSIEKSGRVLLTLIEDILDLSKIEAGKMRLEPVNFHLLNLLEEIVDGFRPQANLKNLELRLEMHPHEEVVVLGDPSRLRQILNNLMSNALKFTDQGSVTLEVVLRSGGSKQSEIEFRVRDTGIGIPSESHSRMFEKFSQIDAGMNRKFGGTGLGLAITKRLVTMMGGKIGFESARGHGSTFWTILPLEFSSRNSVREQQARPQKAVTAEAQNSGTKILVVDDNNDTRHLMGLILRQMGHSATEVDSGKEALNLIQTKTFDLVLMDIQMPEMDGLETTRHIRALPDGVSKIPIIACTANAMAGDKQRFLQAGMNDYVSKPVDRNSLKNVIMKWRNGNGQH